MSARGSISAVLVLVFIQQLCGFSYAQKCDEISEREGFIFPRVFNVMYSGNSSFYATRDRMEWAIGSCGDIDQFANEAIEYFEGYGLDLTSSKQNPYIQTNYSGFIIYPSVSDPKSNYRLVSETLSNYAKHRDTQFAYTSLVFDAKSEIKGPKGTLSAGQVDVYGNFRFKTHGRDFCIKYQARTGMSDFYNPTSAIDLKLYNKYWGEGAARGMTLFLDGTYDLRFTMTFPADP